MMHRRLSHVWHSPFNLINVPLRSCTATPASLCNDRAQFHTSLRTEKQNLNQAAMKTKQTIDAVRQRYEELRRQREKDEEELGSEANEEEEMDIYVKQAYHELEEEEKMRQNPEAWKNRAQFEVMQLFNRRKNIMSYKNRQLKGKTLRQTSRQTDKLRHLERENIALGRPSDNDGDDMMDY